MDKIEIGLKIRQFREQRNLTQMEFAEMIDITDKALSKIEVGRTLPHLNTLVSIATAFNVSVDFLISDDKSVGKELYVNEVKDRVSNMELYAIKHILEYIELYSRTEKEREKELESK